MSRPVNWQKRYEAVLKRHNRLYTKFTKLQQEMTAMKMKHTLEPRPNIWRRLRSPFLLIALLGGCTMTGMEENRVPLAAVTITHCEPKTHMDLFNEDRTRIFLHQSNCTGVYQGRTVPLQVSGDHVYIARRDLRPR